MRYISANGLMGFVVRAADTFMHIGLLPADFRYLSAKLAATKNPLQQGLLWKAAGAGCANGSTRFFLFPSNHKASTPFNLARRRCHL